MCRNLPKLFCSGGGDKRSSGKEKNKPIEPAPKK